MRRLLLIGGLLAAVAGTAQAGSMSLAWEPVPGATGYRIHYGNSSRSYSSVVNVGNSLSHTVSGLADCTRYYVAVTAYDGQGNQSPGYSNEIEGWARPTLGSTGSIHLQQGEQMTLDIDGSNFEPGARFTIESDELPVDQNGNDLLRVENVGVSSCGRLQALVTAETTGPGSRAMKVGNFSVDLLVVNPDDAFGSRSANIQIRFDQRRSDINKSTSSTRDRVDGKDLIWLGHAYGSLEGEPTFNADADLNGDGMVDGEDLAFLSPSFGLCWAGNEWRAEACD